MQKTIHTTRANRFSVRLSDDELQEIETKAELSEISTSEYARRQMLDRQVIQHIVPEINRKAYTELARLCVELQKQGIDINQIVKFAHSHQQLPGELIDRLTLQKTLHDELCTEIKIVQSSVLGL